MSEDTLTLERDASGTEECRICGWETEDPGAFEQHMMMEHGVPL